MTVYNWPGELGDASPTYSGAVGSRLKVRSRGWGQGRPYKVKRVKPDLCQRNNTFLTRVDGQGASFMVPGWEGGQPTPALPMFEASGAEDPSSVTFCNHSEGKATVNSGASGN